MNREIKFRAWDIEGKRMVKSLHGMQIVNGEIIIGIWNNQETEIVEEKGSILMQYTGLKDKNGKQIYEGDIIGGYNATSVVVIEPRLGFVTRNYSGILNGSLGTWVDNNCEIIGNIYENPELLK